jgi:hypothetical protein
MPSYLGSLTMTVCLPTLWGMVKSDACPADDGVQFSLELGTVASALFLLGERQNQGPISAFDIPRPARCMRAQLGASDCARTRLSGAQLHAGQLLRWREKRTVFAAGVCRQSCRF